MSLEGLQEDGSLQELHELAKKCKNPVHKFSDDAEKRLKVWGLIQSDGSVHSSTKNIVDAASKGKGSGFEFVDPISGDSISFSRKKS